MEQQDLLVMKILISKKFFYSLADFLGSAEKNRKLFNKKPSDSDLWFAHYINEVLPFADKQWTVKPVSLEL